MDLTLGKIYTHARVLGAIACETTFEVEEKLRSALGMHVGFVVLVHSALCGGLLRVHAVELVAAPERHSMVGLVLMSQWSGVALFM